MSSNYHFVKKTNKKNIKIKIIGAALFLSGIAGLIFFVGPILSSYALISNVYGSENLASPVPRLSVLNPSTVKNVIQSGLNNAYDVDYTNAKNWFPNADIHPVNYDIQEYKLSIPKIGVEDAKVSTKDYNVAIHLINYGGTAVPPDRGNAVVFGHSSLPQLFSNSNYKTIFAKLHILEKGDTINVNVNGTNYTYQIESLSVVSPEDFTPLMQQYDKSYLTLITCTPPGTTWERLIVKSVLI